MSIDVSSITLKNLIIHPFYERTGADPAPAPKQGLKLISLDSASREALETRLRLVLKSQSKSVQVELANVASASVFQLSASLLDCADADFINGSYELAVYLKKAQDKKGVDSGMVAVMTGTAGGGNNRFVAILRASAKPGFHLVDDDDDGSVGLSYLKSVVLSEDTKLYKIGLYLETIKRNENPRRPSDFDVLVFDHLISKGRDDKAAKYFYDDFMGCSLHQDSPAWCLQFYDETLNYIKQSDLPLERKIICERKLVDYAMSANNDLNAREFADIAFEDSHGQKYETILKRKGVPDRSIVKDVEALAGRTTVHTISLSSNVSIKLPRSVFMAAGFEVLYSDDGFTTFKIPGKVSVDKDDS